MTKKISIVIPHYNSPESLRRLLISISNQTSQIEVFVVDDNSDFLPNFDELELNFEPIFLSNVYAKGAGGARNTALDRVTGDYVLFADADDEFIEGWFNIVKPYLQEEKDIVFFSPDGIREDGQPTSRHLGYKHLVSRYVSSNELDILYKFHVPWSKLFKSSFLREKGVRFDEVIASNDVMFSLAASVSATEFDVSSESVYRVYESSNSLTKKNNFDTLKSRLDTLNRYNSYLLTNVKNSKPYLISLVPILLRMIRYFPLKAMPVVLKEFITAPTVIAFSGLLRAVQRRMKRK